MACQHAPGFQRSDGLPQHLNVGIHHDESAIRIDCWWRRKLQREVGLLAQQHDQIRLGQYITKCAETGIANAARAFHTNNRNAGRIAQLLA